ncbi:MAG: response regulator transcription factor [Acidimicrobiales bacterium]
MLLGARARADRDAEAMEQAATAFEDIGAWLLAAECAAEASVLLRQGGQLRRATALEWRTQALAVRCPGVRTPGLGSITARATLTPREMEIARLAAEGLANREIGERLFLSVRTVENRLHVVYEKLGVEGRAGLADFLAEG